MILTGVFVASLLVISPPSADLTARDSTRIHHAARRAQVRFERVRRQNLPPGVASVDCGSKVGRFCIAGHSRPADESPVIREARSSLLAVLQPAARALPGDAWILGQYVRYALDGNDAGGARHAAEACRATREFCTALLGFVLHQLGDYPGAEGAYDALLSGLTPEQRCEWEDLESLLWGRLRSSYSRLSCAEKLAANRRIWWLAQPLWMHETNDFRTEFLSRHVMLRLERQAMSAWGIAYGADMREMTLRYGWARSFAVHPKFTARPGVNKDVVVGYFPMPAFHFLAGEDAVADPFSATASDWSLHSTTTLYSPGWALEFLDIAAHVARFRRGDSALSVLAYEVPDIASSGGTYDRMLVLAFSEDSTIVESRDTGAARGVLTTFTAIRPHVVGLELLDRRTRRAARMRGGLAGPPDPWVASDLLLSDLLLYEVGAAADSLAQLIPAAVSGHAIGRIAPLGLYWETYGAAAADTSVTHTIELQPVSGGGALRRVAGALRVVRPERPVRLAWTDVRASQSEIRARSVEVDVASLPPGRYYLRMVVASRGRELARTGREITILP